MFERIDIEGDTFWQHDLKCPDCKSKLILRRAKSKKPFDRVRVYYACSNRYCDTSIPANYRGDPVGEVVEKSLREARNKAWKAYQRVIAIHGEDKSKYRLSELFDVDNVSELNRNQCDTLCYLVAMKYDVRPAHNFLTSNRDNH